MYIKLIQPKMKKRPMDTFQHAAEISKYMFIDDNFAGNSDWTKMFLKEIKPMKLKWNAAVSINVANDPRHLDLMRDRNCITDISASMSKYTV